MYVYTYINIYMYIYIALSSPVWTTLFSVTLGTGPRRSLCVTLSETRVYEPHIRARLGTTAHFWTREVYGAAA